MKMVWSPTRKKTYHQYLSDIIRDMTDFIDIEFQVDEDLSDTIHPTEIYHSMVLDVTDKWSKYYPTLEKQKYSKTSEEYRVHCFIQRLRERYGKKIQSY